ncbi:MULTISPECIES: multicopper oxidase family protein [unclassified Ornithinimicrobium]|uniref:multicopper oxidase family protein n=1 Tax=unclassified Ornithinimicrobium TaxID=2615080 RepID=UPI003854DDFB
MRPISRRTALAMGGLGLAGTVVGGTGLWRELSERGTDQGGGTELSEPEVLTSRAGQLEVRLEARLATHTVAGRQARTMGYNGGVPGPTLRVRPGDTLRVELVNQLDHVTNLHVHGLHVSPEGTGDDVFLAVEPGQSHQYEYRLPDDHEPGVYWYHPHHHGTVADQLFAGLYGAIIVEEDDPPPVDRDRVIIVADTTLDDAGAVVLPSTMERMMGREGELVLVNGQDQPLLKGRSGDRERWRIVNACSSRFLSLRLAGQGSRVVGRDGGRLVRHAALDEVVLAPGNRLDLVVDLREGSTALIALPVDRGAMMGGMMRGTPGPEDSERTLASLEVSGGPSTSTEDFPGGTGRLDLREVEVDGHRSLTLQMGMGGMRGGGGGGPMDFTFDGQSFDPDRLDQRARLGTVEEWTIANDGPLDHPFHLHVWPMQLVDAAGERLDDPVWLDVVNVPAAGSVTVRIRFADFGGKTVYHCHILDHEDLGMMGTILVE